MKCDMGEFGLSIYSRKNGNLGIQNNLHILVEESQDVCVVQN